jgi:hypothetical protein
MLRFLIALAAALALACSADACGYSSAVVQAAPAPVSCVTVQQSFAPVTYAVQAAPVACAPVVAAPAYDAGCVQQSFAPSFAPGYGYGVQRSFVQRSFAPGYGVGVAQSFAPVRSFASAGVGYASPGVAVDVGVGGVARTRAVSRGGVFGHRSVVKSKAVVR